MFARNFIQARQVIRRNFQTSAPRSSGHDKGGIMGHNLPFSIQNPWTLAIKMALFFGSGFSIPFIMLRHQLLSKRS